MPILSQYVWVADTDTYSISIGTQSISCAFTYRGPDAASGSGYRWRGIGIIVAINNIYGTTSRTASVTLSASGLYGSHSAASTQFTFGGGLNGSYNGNPQYTFSSFSNLTWTYSDIPTTANEILIILACSQRGTMVSTGRSSMEITRIQYGGVTVFP